MHKLQQLIWTNQKTSKHLRINKAHSAEGLLMSWVPSFIKTIESPADTFDNEETLATEVSLIPAGKITPPVVKLFAAALVIAPILR